MTVDVSFDNYYDVVEMEQILQALAKEYQNLSRLESIGQSHDGRDLWVLTINDFDRGVDTDKPAFWMDGNMHAGEVTGAMAALHMAHRLLTGYGSEKRATLLLQRMAFYIMPRPNPDGAAVFFESPHRELRSGTRP